MNNIKNQDITITPRLRNGKHLNVPVSISDVENFTAKFYTKDISHSIEKEQPNGNDITITWNELLTIAEGELIAFYSYDYDGQHIQYPEATKNYIDNNISEGKDTEFSLSIGGGGTDEGMREVLQNEVGLVENEEDELVYVSPIESGNTIADDIDELMQDMKMKADDINELMQDMKMKKVYYTTTDGEQLGGSIGTTWSGATVVYNSVDENHNGTITFDRPVLEVPNDTFKEKSNLTGITLSPTITSIGGDSLRETGIYEITIPNNATIGNTAFYGCNNLRRVVFNGANSIGSNAFSFSFRNADNVDFDTSNSTIYQTVEGCLTSGSTLIVGNPKTGVIPEGIEVIASNSIAGYSWLNSITLPSTVTSIQNEAITFMDTITITCYATTPPTMGSWQPIGYSSVTAIYVPAESVDAYKEADGWSDFASVISAIIN